MQRPGDNRDAGGEEAFSLHNVQRSAQYQAQQHQAAPQPLPAQCMAPPSFAATRRPIYPQQMQLYPAPPPPLPPPQPAPPRDMVSAVRAALAADPPTNQQRRAASSAGASALAASSSAATPAAAYSRAISSAAATHGSSSNGHGGGSSSLLQPAPLKSSWFSLNAIHKIEMRALPEFFMTPPASSSAAAAGSSSSSAAAAALAKSGDATRTSTESLSALGFAKRASEFQYNPLRTPQVYKDYRDWIYLTYQSDPSVYLHVSTCLKYLVADFATIYRIHKCMEMWELINVQGKLQHDTKSSNMSTTRD